MKIEIDLLAEEYDRMLPELTPGSRLYSILKNGVVVTQSVDGKQRRLVQIICEAVDALMLLSIAQKDCPQAVSAIEKAIKESS